ncbi:MAG: S-layer homology domain-containing protein [Bacillota bacterium]|nr:S-layer homology domain-containing protein [Bacillota bacterium]
MTIRKNYVKGFLLLAVLLISTGAFFMPGINDFAEANSVSFRDLDSSHWAHSSVVQMNSKGVIMGYDDNTFKPNASITRLEAIVMIVRLMGWENTALSSTHIPNEFVNPEAIPAWAKGHVAVSVEKGVLSDDDLKEFQHGDAAKRYEVATFIVRALGLNSEAQRKQSAQMNFSDASEVPEKSRGYVAVANELGFITGSEGKLMPLNLIKRSEMAAILTRIDTYLGANSESFSGIIEDINFVENKITIKLANGLSKSITVTNEASITVDNEKEDFDSLQAKQQVQVVTRWNQVISIKATNQVISYSGKVVDIDAENREFTMEEEDKSRSSFSIPSSLKVQRDGKDVDFTEIKVGDKINIQMLKGEVLKVSASTYKFEAKGIIRGTTFTPQMMVFVEIDGSLETFLVYEGAIILRNSKVVTLKDLTIGDEVDVEVHTDTVIKLVAKSISHETTGKLSSITIGQSNSITITNSDGQEQNYEVSANAIIIREGNIVSLTDLKPGDSVELTLESDVVNKIFVTLNQVEEEFFAKVNFISQQAKVLVVIIEGQDEQYKEVHITDSTLLMKSGAVVRLANIAVNDRVYITGSLEGGNFVADTLIVIGVTR